ncbi:Sporulation kinase E [Planctomycetes bacterium Pan216]|uniref:histidine kinase n=1 Tax=Kolteria novifilia TaxID=2527975 RepID=A0A518B453_9BACT|nr:Sporulation kinase E [Planctomycetes bacterium Pan216]
MILHSAGCPDGFRSQRDLSSNLSWFVDLAEKPDPFDYLSLARQCPDLALVLVEATIPQRAQKESSSDSWASWPSRFLGYPDWETVASKMGERLPEHQRPDRLPHALLAQSIAAMTGWEKLEAVFWSTLLRPSPIAEPLTGVDLLNHLEGTSPSRRCTALAEQLLYVGGAANARQEVGARLSRLFPGIPWPSVLADVPRCASRKQLSLDGDAWRLLRLGARNAALACARHDEEDLHLISLTRSQEELATVLASFLARNICGSIALWLADFGGLGLVLEDGRLSLAEESKVAFEAETLPGHLRRSSPLIGSGGEALSVLYLEEEEATPTLRRQLPALSSALRARQERESLRQTADDCRQRLAELTEQTASESDRRLWRAIAEFAAGAGHEINNPLGTILGKTGELLHGEVDAGRRESLHKIDDQVKRIHRMIRDLHILGREKPASHGTMSTSGILERAVAEASKRAASTQLTLSPIEAAPHIVGRPEDVVRMIAEVIVNALEVAGSEGRVEVAASLERSAGGSEVFRVDVRDSGPGFRDEDRLHAFDPFYSGRSAGRGLGMGLPVARQIAEEHGGRVVIDSGPPTCVSIFLPALASGEGHDANSKVA